MSTNKNMNPALLKELQVAEKSKFTGSVVVTSKDAPLSGKVFFYEGKVYAATVDGYYPRVVARMASSGVVDAAREAHLREHFGGNLMDPDIGAYAVKQEWLGVDQLSGIHQEYLLAILGALLTLPRVKVKRHKNETTNLFCTVPLPLDKVLSTLNMRASRFTGTWIPLTPNANPNAVVPVIINAPALDPQRLRSAEAQTFAAAIDGASTVDQIAFRCGFTRAEAVHLLGIMIGMGAVGLREVGDQVVDPNSLSVPEAAGYVLSAENEIDFAEQEMAPSEEDLVAEDIPAEAFGEVGEDAEEDIEVAPKKEKRGFFRRKKKDAVVEEEVEYDPSEWVTHELSDEALAGYNTPPSEEDVPEGWSVVEDEMGSAEWETDGFAPQVDEMTEEIAVVEEPEPAWEPEPFVPAAAAAGPGLLTQWTQNAELDKRRVRVEVLTKMVEAAQHDVEAKRARLEQAEAEVARMHAELANAEEHGRAQQQRREASEAELAALETIRGQAQADLDAATQRLSAAQDQLNVKDGELAAMEQEIARLEEVIRQARARVEQMRVERAAIAEQVSVHASDREFKVNEVSDASLKVTEYANGPHADAINAEQAANQQIVQVRDHTAQTESARDEIGGALRLAEDVLSETKDEAEQAAALS